MRNDVENGRAHSWFALKRIMLSTVTVSFWLFVAVYLMHPNGSKGSLRSSGPVDAESTVLPRRTLQTGPGDYCAALSASSNCTCTGIDPPKSAVQNVFEWLAVVFLLFLSACFSGLNLGLMSLDMSGLEIVANGSDEKNARYARAIIPVRQHHNWLLTTLLLGNVMVNSLISILLADKTSGALGFIISTAAIVLLGEVFPQAISSRYPLYVGYHSLYIVYTFMAILFVIARPLALLLDKMLGAPIGTIYAHEEFAHLVEMHRAAGALDEDQTKIMKGALDFKHSLVEECMTPIDQVYSLEMNDVIDRKKLKEIFTSGYSRVPVHREKKECTVGMILTKDLILVDPKHLRTVGEVAEIFERTPLFFKPSTSVGKALALFKQGKSHCAVVEDTDEHGQKKTVGFVTLEDILEELLDSEIQDETEDVVHQRFITLDPSFSEKSVPMPGPDESLLKKLRKKGGQSPEIVTNAIRKWTKLGEVEQEVEGLHISDTTTRPPNRKTSLIRRLTPSNRLARVLTDVTNVLGDRLQSLVKERSFVTSLGLSFSETNALSKLTIHLSGEISVGAVTLPSPWYVSVRDSYAASFMVSAVPQEQDIQFNGVSRRVVFNSEDALREPALANDVVHPVIKRTASDPNLSSPLRPNVNTRGNEVASSLARESASSVEDGDVDPELRDIQNNNGSSSDHQLLRSRGNSLRARSKSTDAFDI